MTTRVFASASRCAAVQQMTFPSARNAGTPHAVPSSTSGKASARRRMRSNPTNGRPRTFTPDLRCDRCYSDRARTPLVAVLAICKAPRGWPRTGGPASRGGASPGQSFLAPSTKWGCSRTGPAWHFTNRQHGPLDATELDVRTRTGVVSSRTFVLEEEPL